MGFIYKIQFFKWVKKNVNFFANTNNIMPMFAFLEFFDGVQDFLF